MDNPATSATTQVTSSPVRIIQMAALPNSLQATLLLPGGETSKEKRVAGQHIRKRSVRMSSSAQSPPHYRAPDWAFVLPAEITSEDEDEEADDDGDLSADSDHARSKKHAPAREGSYASVPPWGLDFHRPSPPAANKTKRKYD